MPGEARFWSKVDTSGDCWEWTGQRVKGYGRFAWEHGQLAHRYSYTIHHGAIPDGMTVDHRCFNPGCVRPEHLRLLTHAENAANQRSVYATHCPAGHEYTPENTLTVDNRGVRPTRRCRTCRNEYLAGWRVNNPRPRKPKRTHCRYGHELKPANLVASEWEKGHRICLSCARARAAVKKRPGLDFRVTADSKFAALG